jgi:hypothetical protein
MEATSESPRASRAKTIMYSCDVICPKFPIGIMECPKDGIMTSLSFLISSQHSNIPTFQLSAGFQPFVDFDGADVMPLAFVYDDPPDGSALLHDSPDKSGNNRFDFAWLEKPKERFLHRIDAGKLAALSPRTFQGMSKITDLTRLIDVYIEKRTAAPESKCDFRSVLLMNFQESLQRKIGYHIPIVAEDGFFLFQKIFNVFQSTCCVQKDGFMAKENGYTAPLFVREFL